MSKQYKQKRELPKQRDAAAVALAMKFRNAVHKDGKKAADKAACRKWKGAV